MPNAMRTGRGMNEKPVRIHLMNGDSVILVIEVKATVQQLFDKVCTLLSLKETQFFGLSTTVDDENWFMDLKHRISKYAPKEWGKEIKRRAPGFPVRSEERFTVQFQVQFYVEHPKLITDKVARYLYYLQIKKNVLRSRVLTQDEVLITLASHAMQSDFGDHNPACSRDYFSPTDYFPFWFIKKWGRDYLISHVPSLHAEHVGRTAFQSEALYIQQASGIDDVPVHFYKLFKNKKETEPTVRIGVFHQGIRIHYGNADKPTVPWKLEFEFMWNKVGRLFFAGKRFEIFPEDLPASRRLTYYTGSHARSKYLLQFLRQTHAMHMSLQPYAMHMRRVEGRLTNRSYRESYICGKDLENVDQQLGDDQRETATAEQDNAFKSCYHSKTSQGSSHTSGIESDSKQRTEEEEDGVDHFADDLRPVELPHRGEFVNVTEDHLVGPPPKSLSVNDLAGQEIGEEEGSADRFNLDVKSKPSRDSTLTGEDLCIPSVLPLTKNDNEDRKTPKHSTSSDDGEHTLTIAVPPEVLTNAAMQNDMTSKKRERLRKRESSEARRNRKQVQSLADTQMAFPQNSAADITSKLYYDDFHTVPMRPRVLSDTEGPRKSAELRSAPDPKHSNRARSRPSQTRHEKKSGKRSSSAHATTRKTFSAHKPSTPHADSFNCQSASGQIGRICSSDRATPAFAVDSEKVRSGHDPTSNLRHFQGSADLPNRDSRSSAFVTVARSGKKTEAPAGNDFYTVPRGYDKFVYYDDVLLAAASIGDSRGTKKKKASSGKKEKRRSRCERFCSVESSSDNRDRSSSFEDENFSQKMSEACARTLSAQQERRKLSDSKLSQRMDSGRGSLRTATDDSSGCFDVSPPAHDEVPEFFSLPHDPHRYYLPMRAAPYIEDCREVIV